jgi:phosphate transport system substrate-binding protein
MLITFKRPLRERRSYLVPLLLCAVLSGCDRASDAPSATRGASLELKGRIRVSGAWALYPMMVRWAGEFQKLHPQVRIDVSAGGAGKGVADALANLVDIGMVSREIRPEETARGAVHVPVVIDAVFPTANASNPTLTPVFMKRGIRKQVFLDLWITGKPATWGEISGADCPQKAQVYTRSDSCGAAETWAQYLGGKKQEDLKGVGVYSDPGIAEAVKRDKWGIGYNNLNFAFDPATGNPTEGTVIIPIDINENGRIDPEERIGTRKEALEAVRSGVYPSPPARTLYLVTHDSFKGLAKSFVQWVLADGQQYVDEAGYVALPEKRLSEARAKLNP